MAEKPVQPISPNEYIDGLVKKSQAAIANNPYLLQAYGDYMHVNHQRVDPFLEERWEHHAMWLLHYEFMNAADMLKKSILNSGDRHDVFKGIDQLTGKMKLIAQLVDLALLPKQFRDEVEEWSKRYTQAFPQKT